jgi:hypothetical protein
MTFQAVAYMVSGLFLLRAGRQSLDLAGYAKTDRGWAREIAIATVCLIAGVGMILASLYSAGVVVPTGR